MYRQRWSQDVDVDKEEILRLRRGVDSGDYASMAQLRKSTDFCRLTYTEDELALMEQQDAGGLWFSGFLLLEGRCAVSEDEQRAFRNFEEAASRGHPYAIYDAGCCYSYGEGTPVDERAARRMFCRSSALGCVEASLRVVDAYLGVNPLSEVDVHLFKGCLLLTQLAEQGVTEARGTLQDLLINNASAKMALCPFGVWQPQYHRAWVAEPLHSTMVLCMLVLKRLRVPRDIALHLVSFVCTDNAKRTKSRLQRSIDMLGDMFVFADGRKPGYFGLLDLPSKPFYEAREVSGVAALLADLRENHGALLEEALRVERQEVGVEEMRTEGVLWRAFRVTVGGSEPLAETPILRRLMARHPCVCASDPFSATILSFLYPGGSVHAHYGPTNLRLRLQYPLQRNDACRLYCGALQSTYSDGYAIIDDSYMHSAENLGDQLRVVLVLDVWHPNVDPEERQLITELMQQFV